MSTLTPPPPDPAGLPPPINLAAHYLTTYRSIFYDALYTNKVQPFLLPFCLVGPFILPIAYLCIPHYTVTTIGENQQVRIRREWIHHLRWVIGALIVWWNLGVVVGLPGFGGLGLEEGEKKGGWWFAPGKTTASSCTAIAYAAGLMCGWGTIWGLETVVFGGYQGVAMRVRRRRRLRSDRGGGGGGQATQGKEEGVDGKGVEGDRRKSEFVNCNGNTNTNGNGRLESQSEQNGIKRGSWGPDTTALRQRNLNLSSMVDNGSWGLADTGYGKAALPASTTETQQTLGQKDEEKGKRWTVDETIDLDKYEYYWEPYPDNGTFWERLDWVMDMFNTFRGAGWNYSISSIPSLQPPVISPLPNSILTTSSSSSSSSSSLSQGKILPYHPNNLPATFTPSSPPLSTPQHFHRSTTTRSFLLSRLLHITWSYLALDFFTVSARLDPYFVAGPTGPLRHPTYLSDLASSSSSPSVLPPLSLFCAKVLASLPPWGLDFARSLFALPGVLGGLFLYSSIWQLTQFFVLGRLLGNESQGMDELWRYPSLFGGFVSNVLDRGLAGFWGGWWHQSFRVGFTGPVRFLVKMGIFGDLGTNTEEKGVGNNENGKGKKGKTSGKKKAVAMLEMAVAFFLSGVLHALGGWTSTAFRISPEGEDMLSGDKRNRLAVFAEPVGFFVSQFLGCLVQAFLTVLLKSFLSKLTSVGGKQLQLPRWMKRTGNGLFVLMWLHWTRWMLIDDMSRSGLFLFEPVPVSVFRLFGLGGMPGEGSGDWWRLDGEYMSASLWKGERWWQYGVRI